MYMGLEAEMAEDKAKYRDEHFQIDLDNAYNLGKRLVEMAK